MYEEGSQETNIGQRKFSPEISGGQIIFDGLFGIIGPILCLILDPFVFRSPDSGGLFDNYTVFAYLGLAISIPTLILQHLLGKRLRTWRGVMGGILLAGAVAAFRIGVAIIGFVFLGILLAIGHEQILLVLFVLLGLVPFFTSFVFIRNGLRAIRQANQEVSKLILALSILLGVLIAIGIPGFFQISFHKGLW